MKLQAEKLEEKVDNIEINYEERNLNMKQKIRKMDNQIDDLENKSNMERIDTLCEEIEQR